MDGVLPATNETYQQIYAEADRLNRLVDDLQELSRVEARAYQLDIRPLDVSALARTVTKRLPPHSESKHISLNLELAPDLPHVLADEDRAVQVLTNLTGNALQYTPEGGRKPSLQNELIMKSKLLSAIPALGFRPNIYRTSSTAFTAWISPALVKVEAEAGLV